MPRRTIGGVELVLVPLEGTQGLECYFACTHYEGPRSLGDLYVHDRRTYEAHAGSGMQAWIRASDAQLNQPPEIDISAQEVW